MLRTLAITALTLTTLMGADWTRFRGPGGSGVSGDKGLPTTWSATENVVWKTAMPGFGSSSPITLGDKIFLASYSGYGTNAEEPGEEKNLFDDPAHADIRRDVSENCVHATPAKACRYAP